MTVQHQGGGHKRRYRMIDFRRDKVGIPAPSPPSVRSEPHRARRARPLQGRREALHPGPARPRGRREIITDDTADILPGNCLQLKAVPLGTWVHNVEMQPGRGGQICRSAGSYAQLMAKEGSFVLLRLPSGELRNVLATCRATIGQVGNLEHENVIIGKAGRNRWLGIRPTTRGTAMNPIDHPHGGGEGKAKGRHPVTPWGKPTKGKKTRSKKKPSWRFIVSRRKK
jgi:large subunit ribosomal protein L2